MVHHDHHAHMAADFRKRFWISLVLTLPILVLSPMLQSLVGLREAIRFPGDIYVLFGLSSAVFWYGGWPFLKGLFEELKSRRPGMMTLVAVAIGTAYLYSSAVVFGLTGKMFFWELATLVDIMLLGHWIEMKSVMGASRALEELARLMPSDAHKLMPDGSVKDVPLNELAVDDKVLIKPGEKIPADGVIVDGESSVDEAMLTGESTPVSKKTGGKVIGGAINGEGSLTIEVKGTGKDSFLSQVIDLVKQAQESKSKTQDLANTAALWLTIVALGGGVITFLIWQFLMGKGFAFAIERTVTVMVITCPHALGLAVPLVVAVCTALAASNGLLIRNRVAFEGARKLKAVIFDKTGTLTEGRFGVTETLVLGDDITEETLRSYAASVDANSAHPIARAIAAASDKKLPVEGFNSITGKGAEGRVEGKDIKVVSPGYLRDQNIDLSDDRVEPLQAQGKTVVFVLVDGKLKGAIALADIVRPEAKQAIDALKAMDIRCMMLTGDNKATAKWVSDQVGLDEYFAEVLPQDKAAKVKEVQARGELVAMTGDGVNDAPALAQADLGIAIGAGSDVAVETADVILVRSNPLDVVAIVQLSRATYRKMIQNLIWATGYNVVAIPLAAGALYAWGVVLTPAVGAVLMSASTVIVAINARLLRLKKSPNAKERGTRRTRMTFECYKVSQHKMSANHNSETPENAHSSLPWRQLRRFFAATIAASFVLNEVWEMAQMSAYVETAGRPWTNTLGLCTRAAVGDVGIILGICATGALAAGDPGWGLRNRWNIYTTAALLGLVCATLVERAALGSGRWSYTERMPVVPVLAAGLWPLLQMTLLPPLTLLFARWWADLGKIKEPDYARKKTNADQIIHRQNCE